MPDDLIEHHKRECNRYVNGACTTAACLRRGGWKPGWPQNVDAATCLAHETTIALAAKDAEIERAQSRANQNAAEFEKLMASYQSLRARLAKAEAALQGAVKAMEGVSLFVTSKTRIKYPEGEDWWRDQIADARDSLGAYDATKETIGAP